MANYNKKISDTTVRLGEVRFGYVNVFEPKKNDDGEDKYSICVLIPKTDKQAIKLVEEAIAAAEQKGKTSKWGGKIPSNRKTPLRDGDNEDDRGEEYKGMMFLNASASTKSKPGVRVLENGVISEALDNDDFYSGCWGAVTLNFFPFDAKGNKGVGAGLNNVIKTRDDEKLAGGASAESDFADMADLLN